MKKKILYGTVVTMAVVVALFNAEALADGGSHHPTNPSGRYDIGCAYGSDNCSSL